jgi:hypothetical protein
MSKEELHAAAMADTPASVDIPQSWAALIVWAVGKWGAGAVFLCLLVPVYLNGQAHSARFAEIASATARAIDALAIKIEAQNTSIQRLDDALRRIETDKHP